MCMCTQYAASTCGHSWISLTHQCGPFRNLLTCPCLETFQTLAAPPFTCPQCHCGFQDEETLRMISNGWGGPTMIANGHGGHGFLGGWGGGGGGMFPGFGGGRYNSAGPVVPVVPGGGYNGAGSMVPMLSGRGCGGGELVPVVPGGAYGGDLVSMVPGGGYMGRRSSGWFGSSGRNNRRYRHSSHSYSESAPVNGCTVM
ncbi:hypothetical protein K505DRAFT_60544 [Melanomma pulvis-pyrius CBS 109.77]|uniref:Uncharacterized protein n=1 Tax=Melanomma pulvis-pyrius CBS 109.77 TaxID=1314802 RepID=A0A6A6XVB3_9PLEO|nr:hypothetical protein K505DRAFT_60544 [Melanomma pulvis-pyrius CBS 109.77]